MIRLYLLRFKTDLLQLIENIRVALRYYHNKEFRRRDLALLKSSFCNNPYKIGSRYVKESGNESYTYGETPLTSLEKIVKECDITKEDKVFELGSGRGRAALWLAAYLGCKVVAIENVPELYELSKKALTMPNIKVIRGNFLKRSLEGATVVFLFGSCLSEEEIDQLTERVKSLKKNTKIITVSFPLKRYCEVVKVFEVPFLFGKASVYYQLLRERAPKGEGK